MYLFVSSRNISFLSYPFHTYCSSSQSIIFAVYAQTHNLSQDRISLNRQSELSVFENVQVVMGKEYLDFLTHPVTRIGSFI